MAMAMANPTLQTDPAPTAPSINMESKDAGLGDLTAVSSSLSGTKRCRQIDTDSEDPVSLGSVTHKDRLMMLLKARAPTVPSPSTAPATVRNKGHVVRKCGDVCKASENLIAQQCNCISRKPHGLSSHIARVLGVDPYSKRPGVHNTADKSARPRPGTLEVLEATKKPGVRVACLYGQVGMGTSGSFSGSFGVRDAPCDRLQYFQESLEALAIFMKSSDLSAVAVPDHIGCGLAGGDWTVYEKVLKDFAEKHGVDVVLYKL